MDFEPKIITLKDGRRARALYEKMGFRIVATVPGAIMQKTGMVNEYIMQKYL